jgi:apolipoprotein N-acyltransferase
MELTRRARWVGTGLGFACLWLATPGVITAAGLWPLGVVGAALWARYASRPGRWALGIEAAAGALAWCGIFWWATYVWPGTLLFIGPGFGVYMAATGWALRRFARKWPLGVAAPLAWVLFETVRTQLAPPLGVSWMRLGTYLHDQAWIAGSARVWGTGGLTVVVVALGGAIADLVAMRGRKAAGAARPGPLFGVALGCVPLVAGVVLARVVPSPRTVDGPRVMLVQPAFEQARKQEDANPLQLLVEQIDLTRAGLAEAKRAGEPEPDLVAWGETMLRIWLVDPGVKAAIEQGAAFDPWRRDAGWGVEAFDEEAVKEREWVGGVLFGRDPRMPHPILPAGTSFLSGAEWITARDGRIRFKNSVFLWPADGGERRGPASKVHLAPGGETMVGLEELSAVRSVIYDLARYVPDFLEALDDDPVLAFTARDGRTFRIGAAVCFDNAFDDVFTRTLRCADVDFHLVVSNEAWFKQSSEADQMMAYSHLAAIATGRSVVRATNSGVSAVIGPDGSEVARLTVGGEDREVRGTLRAVVPVVEGGKWSPFEVVEGERAPTTFFVRWELFWTAAFLAVPALLLALGFRGGARGASRN